VHTRLETHFAGQLADAVETLAHGAESGLHVHTRLETPGREHHQVLRSEDLQELHGCTGVGQDLGVLRCHVRRPAERNRGDVQIAFRDLLFHLRRRNVVGLENAREAGEPDADEAGVLHLTQDFGEGPPSETAYRDSSRCEMPA